MDSWVRVLLVHLMVGPGITRARAIDLPHQSGVARIPALGQQGDLDIVVHDRFACSLTWAIIDPAYGQNGVVRIILISVESGPRRPA